MLIGVSGGSNLEGGEWGSGIFDDKFELKRFFFVDNFTV